jgi:putative flippase GtrA
VLALLVELVALPEFLSALVAIGFTTPVSFGANRLWTFSHR